MRPISLAATQVNVADSWMSVSTRTLRPMDSGGVSSTEPSRHLTYGIGDPTATHVRFAEPPGITSTFSGGNEKCGARRITATTISHIRTTLQLLHYSHAQNMQTFSTAIFYSSCTRESGQSFDNWVSFLSPTTANWLISWPIVSIIIIIIIIMKYLVYANYSKTHSTVAYCKSH